jgi:hypothetical protein
MSKVTTIPAKPHQIKVSLDLQAAAQSVAKHAGKGGDPAIDALVNASTLITDTAAKIEHACNAILSNAMDTPIKNASTAKRTALKLFENVASKSDNQWQQTEKLIAELEASTMPAAPKDPVSAIHAGHVYQALRGMTDKERTEAVIHGSDAFSAAALTCTDEALTGVPPAQRAALLRTWCEKRHGETLDRVARLRGGLDAFHKSASRLQKLATSVCDEEGAAIEAAELSAKLATEALAKAS